MKQKVITVLLLLFAAIILLLINFINDWFVIAIGLFLAGTSLLSASILLLARRRNENSLKNKKS
jgi:hypothetical protein